MDREYDPIPMGSKNLSLTKGTVYYMGGLKDNRPDGEGAIFAITTSGERLLYAGDFKDGRRNGKGASFTATPLGAVLQESASYENDVKDGKCTD